MNPRLYTFCKVPIAATILLFAAIAPAIAQQNSERFKRDSRIAGYEWNDKRGSLESVSFQPGNGFKVDAADSLLRSLFTLSDGIDGFELKNTTKVDEHMSVLRYQQTFKGLKVALGTVAVVVMSDAIMSMRAEFYPVPQSTSVNPNLPENAALAHALNYIHATRYMWEEAGVDSNAEVGGYPKGQLVIINDIYGGEGVKLAYRFDVYATQPLSRTDVYVSATNGAILFSDAILKHTNATGTAATKYSGTKAITTDYTGSAYRLQELISTMNGGIKTFNLKKKTTYSAGVDFTDADNNWTAAEYNNSNLDNAALDAHWAAEQVYSYWLNMRGRNSYDNNGSPLISFVHYDSAYNNAFWNGSYMSYGDGTYAYNGTGFRALTSIDVCGHELAHGVCQYTAGLTYSGESGALNEGFSDIWGACVEHNVDPTNSTYETFLIGEQLYASWVKNSNRIALRDMANPPARFQPDTYGSGYWVTTTGCTPSSSNDQCGVHTNSGVINKWFYLLTVGGSGTNGLSNSYSVSGIGWEKSQKIVYATELTLTASANYAATRSAAISVASALYGACSQEAAAVTNSWYAVGVGAAFSSSCTPIVRFDTTSSGLSTSVSEGIASTSCHPSKTITTTVRIDGSSTQPTGVTLVTGGTATQGVDYDISPASFTFAAGGANSQDVTITVYDDAVIEGTETLTLGYTLAANGGTAVAGSNAQVFTLNILDDDAAPSFGTTSSSAITLLNENFGTSGGALPAGWSATLVSGSTNTWVVGTNGTVGSGQGAYISNNASTKPLGYTTTVSAIALLRTSLINASSSSGMTLSFDYKCNGEWDNISDYDFGLVDYSFDGITYKHLPVLLEGVTTATNFSAILPDSIFANKNFYIGFRWINDNSVGTNPPFTIDNVLLTGTQTLKKVSVETQNSSSRSEYIPASSAVNIYSAQDGEILTTLSGASVNKGCVNVSLTGSGNGQTSVTTSAGTMQRTQKVFQVSPGTPDATTTYQLTLYFSPAELAVWGANKTNLKFLKVADGVSLSSAISSGNYTIVTPTSVNDQSASGYIAYTGNFTGFSQFMLVNNSAVALPVRFLSIAATPRERSIDVSWATASEQANKGFFIERSVDGTSFQSIGWIAGAGNTSTEQHYSYPDEQVIAGQLYYYRVRQVDLAGQETFSAIRSARIGEIASGGMTLSPNPAGSYIRLSLGQHSEGGSIQLRNLQGMLVKSFTAESLASPLEIDVAGLPAGVYMLSVKSGAEVWMQKFVKQ